MFSVHPLTPNSFGSFLVTSAKVMMSSLHTVGERSLTHRGAKSGGHPSQTVDSGQKVSDHPRPKHPPTS